MNAERLRLDGIKTLMVDGDRANATLLLEILRGMGFTILKRAESAAAAFAALDEAPHDL